MTYLMQGMHMSAMDINLHLICVCHMQEQRNRNDVETLLLLFLAKIISLHIKPENILELSRLPIKLPPFRKIPLHVNLCW